MNELPLQALIELVRAAGQAILPYWRQPLEVSEKSDSSPVTAADLAAHACLRDGLQALGLGIPLLSEEDAEIPLAERLGWSRWWLVDPLDGTKEFIAGSDEFTVNLALIEDGQVRFGLVGIPASGRVYYGGAGFGAWRVDPGQAAQPLAVRDTPEEAFVLVASRRHSSPAQERLLAGLGQWFADLQLTSVGSSLKFCLLAEGAADCYPRLAPTSQWDTAAAQAVLEGAGGLVVDLHGEPLRYPPRADFLNPHFLALPQAAPWRSQLLQLARSLD